jgi:hypothetical protein
VKFDHILGTQIDLCELDFGMSPTKLSNRHCSRCCSEVFYLVRAMTYDEERVAKGAYETKYFSMCEGCKILAEIQ